MEELTAYREDLILKLGHVVDDLYGITARIPSNAWHVKIAPYAHTPHHILAHLEGLEALLFNLQLHRIVQEDRPIIPVFRDESWMADHYDPDKPVPTLLEGFTELRTQEVKWLRALSPVEWSRTARHPWWGIRTLQWWVELQLSCSNQQLKTLSAYSAE